MSEACQTAQQLSTGDDRTPITAWVIGVLASSYVRLNENY